MKTNRLLALATTFALCLSTIQIFAQNDPQGGDRPRRSRDGNPPDGGGQGGGRGGFNFDPAEIQKRMVERTKEQLEITDETEWKAIEPLVAKVNESRFAAMAGGFGRGGFGRGGRGGDQGGGGTPPGMPANPERDALQKAIDAKAPASELKSALAKFQEARKAKQAELEKAQGALRKVLTPRQEALAALNGLL